jgi:hypothetical protein
VGKLARQANIGDSNIGDSNIGDSNIGDSNIGDSNIGDSNIGESTICRIGWCTMDGGFVRFRAAVTWAACLPSPPAPVRCYN